MKCSNCGTEMKKDVDIARARVYWGCPKCKHLRYEPLEVKDV